jgi:hypothetical protein
MHLDDITPLSRFFGLFVGPSGDGKSCAAVSFPAPIYCFDLDDRIKGALAAKKWLGKIDLEFHRYFGYADIEKKLDEFVKQVNAKNFKYKTILFDSVTSSSRSYIQEAVALGAAGDTSDDGKPRRLGTVYMPGWNAYNYESIAHYNVIIAYLKKMPCNVIVSAHKTERFNKKGEMTGIDILARPKIAAELPTNFDEVYEFERDHNEIKKTTTYRVTFRGDLAKTVMEKAPYGAVDITEKNFYKLLQSYYGALE